MSKNTNTYRDLWHGALFCLIAGIVVGLLEKHTLTAFALIALGALYFIFVLED